jgi:hypothetical protein
MVARQFFDLSLEGGGRRAGGLNPPRRGERKSATDRCMLRDWPQGKRSRRGSHEGVDASDSSADGQADKKRTPSLSHFYVESPITFFEFGIQARHSLSLASRSKLWGPPCEFLRGRSFPTTFNLLPPHPREP